jgi:hypothetical protein
MARVAIAFGGLPRVRLGAVAFRWRDIIEKYDADVFVHTWVQPDDPIGLVGVEQIKYLYDPLVLKGEPARSFPMHEYQDRVWNTVKPFNVLSMFASIKEGIHLASDYAAARGFQYDYIIRSRFDVLATLLELEPAAGVVVPDDPDKSVLKFKYRGEELCGVNDLLAYGNHDAMMAYASTIDEIPSLYHDEEVGMCAEVLLTASLFKKAMPIVPRPIKTFIVRN